MPCGKRTRFCSSATCLTALSCIAPADRWEGDSAPVAPAQTLSAPEPVPFRPDALLADACGGAFDALDEARDYQPFPSAEAAAAALARTWVRCIDDVVSDHAGVQIHADGSWNDLSVANGELIARQGFDHEGSLRMFGIGGDATPGLYGFDLLPDGVDLGFRKSSAAASDRALIFATNPWGDTSAVYLPTSLPVRAAAPSEYAAGERAGETACSSLEQGVITSSQESLSVLSGDFVLCSGALIRGVPRLHFDGAEVEFRTRDGQRLGRAPYSVQIDFNDRLWLLLESPVLGPLQWGVLLSRRPRKLWIEASGGSAVFSALP